MVSPKRKRDSSSVLSMTSRITKGGKRPRRGRAVCSLWRCVSGNHIPRSLVSPPSPPPILWTEEYADRDYWLLDASAEAGGNLYLPNRKTGKFFDRNNIVCVGSSSDGQYLLFHSSAKNKKKDQLYLFNPLLLSAFAVRFPPTTRRRRFNGIQNVLVLSDPVTAHDRSSSFCCYGVVVLDYDYKLLFSKCGGTSSQFSQLECQNHESTGRNKAMTIINNCLYAITSPVVHHYMEAWDCDNQDGPRKVLDFEPAFSSDHEPLSTTPLHLVESQGELLLVAIRCPHDESKLNPSMSSPTPICMVYRMDFKEKKWVHMDSLGDRVLFIMEYQSMSLSANEFPQYQRNSIYFRRYYARYRGPKSVLGIFNMDDGSLKEIVTTVVG